MSVFYHVLEILLAFVAIVGTWEVARATVARGGLEEVFTRQNGEDNYSPWATLNPINLLLILKWIFRPGSNEKGVSSSQILEKRFAWGLRYLISAMILMCVLQQLRFLFFES